MIQEYNEELLKKVSKDFERLRIMRMRLKSSISYRDEIVSSYKAQIPGMHKLLNNPELATKFQQCQIPDEKDFGYQYLVSIPNFNRLMHNDDFYLSLLFTSHSETAIESVIQEAIDNFVQLDVSRLESGDFSGLKDVPAPALNAPQAEIDAYLNQLKELNPYCSVNFFLLQYFFSFAVGIQSHADEDSLYEFKCLLNTIRSLPTRFIQEVFCKFIDADREVVAKFADYVLVRITLAHNVINHPNFKPPASLRNRNQAQPTQIPANQDIVLRIHSFENFLHEYLANGLLTLGKFTV